jgi:hypothetical protein
VHDTGSNDHFDDDTAVIPQGMCCDLINKLIVLDVTVMLLTVLAFRPTGFEQVGSRFSLDSCRSFFWLLMRGEVRLTHGFKGLILGATVKDLCLTVFCLATRYGSSPRINCLERQSLLIKQR